MMELLQLNWFPIIITFFGTLFLFGEILVNMRGIFAVLGILIMGFFFTSNVESGSLALMVAIHIIGLLLIIIDGKLINDGTLGTIGLVSVLTAVALAAPNLTAGLYAVIGVLRSEERSVGKNCRFNARCCN